MSNNTDIPEEFEKWVENNANEKYYCGGDLPDSHIYEAVAANEAYNEGALGRVISKVKRKLTGSRMVWYTILTLGATRTS